jgi:aldose 1-epimerase
VTVEWTLSRGQERAVVCSTGGRLKAWSTGDLEVLAGDERPERTAYRGALLVPWPNRVAGGRWQWEGAELQLPVNDEGGAALHGLVLDAEFRATAVEDDRIELVHDLAPSEGYPFALQVTASYALEDGLHCRLAARNTGDRPAPVGLGVHPYLAAPGLVDDLELRLPARTELLTDATWRETGRVARPALVGRFGDRRLDTAFTDLSERRAVIRTGAAEVVLSWGRSARWLVVYSGDGLPGPDHRGSLAVEPQTCPPNALQSGEVDVLAPGEELELTWSLSAQVGG